MTKNKAEIILEETWQSFELSLLGYTKKSSIISKIKNTQYWNVRRLAMIRLYLCDSYDWQNWTKNHSTIKWSEEYVRIWNEEINSLKMLWIKPEDVITLINKAYLIYFWDSSVQYSFNFDKKIIKKDYNLAIEYLDSRIRPKEYFEWDIKWYMRPHELVIGMMYMVERCGFSNLVSEFQEFIKKFADSDLLINEKLVQYFYWYLKNIITEELENQDKLNSTINKVNSDIDNIIK